MSDKINELLDTLTGEQVRALAYGAVEGMAKMGAEEEWDSETIENVAASLWEGATEDMQWFGDSSQDREALNYWRRLIGWSEAEIAEEDEEFDFLENLPDGRHYARVTHPDGTVKGEPYGNLSWLGAHTFLMSELNRHPEMTEAELERIDQELKENHHRAQWNGYVIELLAVPAGTPLQRPTDAAGDDN